VISKALAGGMTVFVQFRIGRGLGANGSHASGRSRLIGSAGQPFRPRKKIGDPDKLS
jgi:hypothetical protein